MLSLKVKMWAFFWLHYCLIGMVLNCVILSIPSFRQRVNCASLGKQKCLWCLYKNRKKSFWDKMMSLSVSVSRKMRSAASAISGLHCHSMELQKGVWEPVTVVPLQGWRYRGQELSMRRGCEPNNCWKSREEKQMVFCFQQSTRPKESVSQVNLDLVRVNKCKWACLF